MAYLALLFAVAMVLVPKAGFAQDLSFTDTKIADQNAASSIVVGPDGNLYVGDADGSLFRYGLNPGGDYTGKSENLLTNQGRILGLAFDPAATAQSLVLWASLDPGTMTPTNHSGSTSSWKGKIVKLTLPAFGTKTGIQSQDIVVGLPTGFHENNQIKFGPDGLLYLAQGSMTTGGYPTNGAGSYDNRPETKLSAAILQIDPKSITQPPLNVATDNGGSYVPSDNAPVRLFATGVRNTYGLTWHEGQLYSSANESDNGFGKSGPCGKVPVLTGYFPNESFKRIQKGKFYGFPNPDRNECVLYDGNTGNKSPWQVSGYPSGTQPEPNYDLSTFLFNMASISEGSPNGMISYNVPGPLKGRIVIAGFGASKMHTVVFNTDGSVKAIEDIKSSNGQVISIQRALDVALHPNGNLYVASYGYWGVGEGGAVHLLKPNSPAPISGTNAFRNVAEENASPSLRVGASGYVEMPLGSGTAGLASMGAMELTLVSLRGEAFRLSPINKTDRILWDVRSLSPGLYLARLGTQGHMQARKIIIPR